MPIYTPFILNRNHWVYEMQKAHYAKIVGYKYALFGKYSAKLEYTYIRWVCGKWATNLKKQDYILHIANQTNCIRCFPCLRLNLKDQRSPHELKFYFVTLILCLNLNLTIELTNDLNTSFLNTNILILMVSYKF